MKRIFAFNLEHDLALANGDSHFIAPKNIRDMSCDLAPLLEVMSKDPIMVWGWDNAVVEQLCKMGVSRSSLPSPNALKNLRHRSERQTAHRLLRNFREADTHNLYCGESFVMRDSENIDKYAAHYGHILLKAPLSSSGKGIRHVINGGDTFLSWCKALIRRHEYFMLEPFYEKAQDFAMEFRTDRQGCHFIGYSLFNTDHHGRYIESYLMSDSKIEDILSKYIPRKVLDETRQYIIAHHTEIIPNEWDVSKFPLYFGIDMMIVKDTDLPYKIHPCVEINLRMNMGIIAHEVYAKYLAPEATGRFYLVFFADNAELRTFFQEKCTLNPASYIDNRLVSGYLPLTPIDCNTRHHAYILCNRD